MDKICVYYNFTNNRLEGIVRGIFNFFYYNNNLLFSLSACQIEVSFHDINKDFVINENNSFNVLLLDEQFFSITSNVNIDRLIKRFENKKSIIIFLESSPINPISINYLYFDEYSENKIIRTQIVNAIAIKYIQNNYPKIEVFISYARADGLEICLQVSSKLENYLGLNHFVDIHSIALGDNIQNAIEKKCKNKNCYMLYILTDIYKDRYYCNKENFYAKSNDRPGIIYNCINSETIRTPLLTNCLEIMKSDNAIELLISGLCQLIIRNRVYLDNVLKLKREQSALKKYQILNNRFDYSALSLKHKSFIYPGNPIYGDESNLYNVIKKTQIISYMECIFNVKKEMNISISTSEVETSLYSKLLSESFFDLIIQCMIFSGCKIHTALNIHYANSKLERIIDISNKYYDKHLNNNKYEAVCINYIPLDNFESISKKIIAENKRNIEFICCEIKNDKYSIAREKMITSSDCLLIFGGKFNGDLKNSGIYKEYELAIKNKKTVIIISKIGGFTEQLANNINLSNKPSNVHIIDNNNIYSILKEITEILNMI